jgi:gas vesicle protein
MARDAFEDDYDDERVVVIRRDRGTAGVGMLLLGLALGAGAALLFAPASGAETRERLQNGARRAGRKMRDVADEFGEEMTDRVDQVRDTLGARTQAVRDAVHVGREAAAKARVDLERNLADAKSAYADRRRTTESTADDAPLEG